MTDEKPADPADIGLARIDRAARPAMRRVAALETLAGAIWPLQAACIAYIVSGWVAGGAAHFGAAVAVFVAAGVLRALLGARAGAIAFETADALLRSERAALVAREARRAEHGTSSAALAALAVDKLPLLVPYISRYRPAMARARVLPILIMVLCAPVSWIVVLILLVAGPLIPAFMALIGMAAREASDRQMAEIGDLNTMLMDRLAALSDLRLLDAAGRSTEAFAGQAEALRSRTMAVLRVAFLSSTVLELFSALGVAMVAVFVGFSLLGEITFGAGATPLTVGEGVFLLLLAPEFFQPLRDFAAAWHDRASARSVAAELVVQQDGIYPEVLGTGGPAAPLDGPAALELAGVTVQRGTRVVRLPDLMLRGGDTMVLSGPSGSGKSTCLAAIAGLLPVASGQVTVSGQALSGDTADAWRARLAWVPQNVQFRDQTLREFLTERGEGDIAAALRAAHADGVVARLPGGLDARLGETGAGVSGGEARRLLLARALLSGADVVLADEPTADLDAETAAKIIATLKELAGAGAAVLVASHDPAVIAELDHRVEMGAA